MFIRKLRRWERSSPVKLQVKTTFDFGKLARKMPDILKHYGNVGAKALAADARRMIQQGKLPNVTEGTMEIAKKNWTNKSSHRGSGARKGTKSQALIHTGKLLSSIKAVGGDVWGIDYLEHHLQEYIIVRNKWTKHFTPYIVGKPVPGGNKSRNPFFTPKGALRKPVKERMTAHKKGIYKLIGKHLKKHG